MQQDARNGGLSGRWSAIIEAHVVIRSSTGLAFDQPGGGLEPTIGVKQHQGGKAAPSPSRPFGLWRNRMSRLRIFKGGIGH